MNAQIVREYDEWKVGNANSHSLGYPGHLLQLNLGGAYGSGYVSRFSDWNHPDPTKRFVTVSEGMGYAMLLAVVMDGYKAGANEQAIFDGYLKTVRARPARDMNVTWACSWPNPETNSVCQEGRGENLMEWRLGPNGEAGAGGYWNAADGDLDIALALLMAHRQWGTSGTTWIYRDEAIKTIKAIKARNFYPDGSMKTCRDATVYGSRPSDFMIGHFRAFRQASGDPFWDVAISKSLALVQHIQSQHSGTTGLVPDWIYNSNTSTPVPAPNSADNARCEANPREGSYWFNAMRDPLRWGTEYAFSGNDQWKAVVKKMTDFFVSPSVNGKGGTGGDPGPLGTDPWWPKGNFATGYELDGTHINTDPGPSRGIAAGAMVGAMIDSQYQVFLDRMWDWMVARWYPGYYDSDLTLLAQLVVSGNWWLPSGSAPPPPPPAGTTIQAEDPVNATRTSDLYVKNDIQGFGGTGFVYFQGTGTVTATFANVAAGTYRVKARYHSYNRQEESVRINGGAATTVEFPPTNGTWQDLVVFSNVTLNAGTNTVAVSAPWGWIDLDSLTIEPVSAVRTVEAEQAARTNDLQVKNDIQGFRGTGFVYFQGSGTVTATFTDVAAGTYRVKVRYHAYNRQEEGVRVNGGTTTTVEFPPTSGTWQDLVVLSNVTLVAGANTVAVSAPWGWIDLDSIAIEPSP